MSGPPAGPLLLLLLLLVIPWPLLLLPRPPRAAVVPFHLFRPFLPFLCGPSGKGKDEVVPGSTRRGLSLLGIWYYPGDPLRRLEMDGLNAWGLMGFTAWSCGPAQITYPLMGPLSLVWGLERYCCEGLDAPSSLRPFGTATLSLLPVLGGPLALACYEGHDRSRWARATSV